jgi:microcystin-dependent protein
LLAVSQNDALFSLFGTIYGGDGRTTFGLPDLRGRIPVHQGTGPGLSSRRLGQKTGAEKVPLTLNQLPSHSHTVQASNTAASSRSLNGNVLARGVEINDTFYVNPGGTQSPLIDGMVANTGGSQSHTNIMPSLAVHFIVALVGIYPSRN